MACSCYYRALLLKSFSSVLARRAKCMRQPCSSLQLCQIFTDLIFFTHRLSNKPFLIRLLTTPPHLKYVATLPCNLSLIACFADINVSRGSVATYARCGGFLKYGFNYTNLPKKSSSVFLNRLRFDRIMVMSLWPHFFGPPRRSGYATSEWCRPQYTPTCLESSDCSRSARWMQTINFLAFSCRHFNFTNSAAECTRTRHFRHSHA